MVHNVVKNIWLVLAENAEEWSIMVDEEWFYVYILVDNVQLSMNHA